MSVSKCFALAAGLLWLLAMLLPVAASEHGSAGTGEQTDVSVAGGFPGWMRLVVVESALQRVARGGESGAGANAGPAGAGITSTGTRRANPADSALEQAGLGPVVSLTSATVALSTIDGVDREGLEVVRERLIPLDPRRDAYIETAPALFDAWSGDLDPARDAPDAEVVFFPEAQHDEVEAVMTEAGFASDEWVLVDANDESSGGSQYPTPRLIAGITLIGTVLVAAVILLLRRKPIFVRVFGLVLIVGVGLLAWWLVQPDYPADESDSTARQWYVVSVTADTETVDLSDDLFEAGQADFETAQNPDIPHFGILLSHLAYQEAFAWGREFFPPRRGEVVHMPGLPPGNAHDRDMRIVFDQQWLELRTSAERDPLAALLRTTAGMAPLEYRRIEVPVARANMSPARAHAAPRVSGSSLRTAAAHRVSGSSLRTAAALPRPALAGTAAFVGIFFIRLQRVRRSDRVVQRLKSNCVLITSAFFLIKCLRAKTCLRRHR